MPTASFCLLPRQPNFASTTTDSLPWQPSHLTRFSLALAKQLSAHQVTFVRLLSELQEKEAEEGAGFNGRAFEGCTSQIRDIVAEVSCCGRGLM